MDIQAALRRHTSQNYCAIDFAVVNAWKKVKLAIATRLGIVRRHLQRFPWVIISCVILKRVGVVYQIRLHSIAQSCYQVCSSKHRFH
jgi:hypothetical protein